MKFHKFFSMTTERNKKMKVKKFKILALIFLPAMLILQACHSGPPRISIENAKAQLSPAIYGEAMVFMTIKNDGGPDVLEAASLNVPGAQAMFHMMKGHNMAQVTSVAIPGGKSVVFKMGSSHIMIEDMPRGTVAGSPFTLALTFQKSGVENINLKLEKAPSEKAPPMNMPSMD